MPLFTWIRTYISHLENNAYTQSKHTCGIEEVQVGDPARVVAMDTVFVRGAKIAECTLMLRHTDNKTPETELCSAHKFCGIVGAT